MLSINPLPRTALSNGVARLGFIKTAEFHQTMSSYVLLLKVYAERIFAVIPITQHVPLHICRLSADRHCIPTHKLLLDCLIDLTTWRLLNRLFLFILSQVHGTMPLASGHMHACQHTMLEATRWCPLVVAGTHWWPTTAC